jgi:hypothetical protein
MRDRTPKMLVFPGLGLKAGMLSEQTWRLLMSVEQYNLLANVEGVNTFLSVGTPKWQWLFGSGFNPNGYPYEAKGNRL